MHTEKREDPLVELGYEVRDLNTVAIRNAAIGFFAFAIISAAIGFGAYRVMNPTVFEPKKAGNRMIPPEPNPLVQSNIAAKVDIMDLRQHETAVLTAPPGWTDETRTHVHIPIDEAMNIIARKGLTPTGQSVPAVTVGHTPNPEIGEKPTTPSGATANPPATSAAKNANMTGSAIVVNPVVPTKPAGHPAQTAPSTAPVQSTGKPAPAKKN